MRMRRIRRYLILPVLYVGVIFGLLFLQFSGRLTVRRTIDGLEFSGTLIAGADETSNLITAARVSYEGLEFSFSESEPIVLASSDGDDEQIVPESYEIVDDELQLMFNDQSIIRFAVTESESPELHMIPIPTDRWPQTGRLVIPYRLNPEAEAIDLDPNNPENQEILFGERRFFLSAPPMTVFDTTQNQLVIPLDGGGSQLIRYAEITGSEENVIEASFGDSQRQIGEVRYEQTINDFFDSAYFGWSAERFNGGSGTWEMRDGGPRFSERILTAYLSEAWRRNEYTPAFNQMRRAADLHPEAVGFLSAVFLGNLRTVSAKFVEADAVRTRSLSSRISAGDPTVFREEDLIRFAALHGSEQLYRQVLDFAGVVDFRTVGLPTAVGMLVAAVDTEFPSADAEAATRRFLQIVEERIFPAVRRFDEYFFVETAQGKIDLYWSIRAGQMIEILGRETDNELYTTVGRNLVMSGFQLADPQGFLPEFLFFSENGIQRREGSFGPERIYHAFTENPWYPREISLYEQLGAGSFIWTIADFTRVEITDQQYSFRLEYPENQTHYIIMQGIPQFDSMQLFGLQWRNDRSFESYIKGRHYEPTTETLMIKYTDNSTVEDIFLYY